VAISTVGIPHPLPLKLKVPQKKFSLLKTFKTELKLLNLISFISPGKLQKSIFESINLKT